jgi:hypothetical protein
VGHYGIFNGSRFRREIATRIATFARKYDGRASNGPPEQELEHAGNAMPYMVGHEPSNAAFTFRAANDEGETSTKASAPYRSRGAETAREDAAAEQGPNLFGTALGMGLAPLRLWHLAGVLVLQQLAGMGPGER